MRRIRFILCFLLLVNLLAAQSPDSWAKVADFSGTARSGAISFSIGGMGYAGLGIIDTFPFTDEYRNDFWQYNPVTNLWTQKASFPGLGRQVAVCFVIGAKAYIGLGVTASNPYDLNDFWEYDPASDTWTQLANFGGGERREAVGFSIGNKGYVGLGTCDTASGFDKDFWEYDPISDAWTQLGDFAGGARCGSVGFGINGMGYVGFGFGINNIIYYQKDFWQYDPVSDRWMQIADFGGKARVGSFVFCIGDKGYIGTGIDSADNNLKDLWEYNTQTGNWTQKDSFGGAMRVDAAAFSIGNYGYAGTGDTTSGNTCSNDFWMYTPDSLTTGIRNIDVSDISIYPDPAADKLSINNLPPSATLTISDMTGRVYTTTLSGQHIDVSALPTGVYCLHIQDSGGSVVRKFVKE